MKNTDNIDMIEQYSLTFPESPHRAGEPSDVMKMYLHGLKHCARTRHHDGLTEKLEKATPSNHGTAGLEIKNC